ncbi:MAG TPA: serine hydrolase domain-containing protein, partial [Streptosporangiaceae bacterium]|nr:serine hydrolase domain-containing protein [Streptosporangiaceae bacterium]
MAWDHQAQHIVAIARQVMRAHDLKAVIISVRIGSRNVVTKALGDSMTGVPATPAMHFRNGSVAISYLTTVLLELVDRKVVRLDARLSRWLPWLPHADSITLEMLAANRSGYADYVTDKVFESEQLANVFRAWTRAELIHFGISKPLLFRPGTSFGYAHTNFVILGQALEKITGQPIARLIQEYIYQPLGLQNTATNCTAQIPQPVLHAFTSDRGVYEDSTYWNPSWSIGCGLVETTDVADLIKSAVAIGTGSLLTRRSHLLQVTPRSRITVPGKPTVYYGLGIFIADGWLLQNPLFDGYQAIMAYLPSKQISIAVTTTVGP